MNTGEINSGQGQALSKKNRSIAKDPPFDSPLNKGGYGEAEGG